MLSEKYERSDTLIFFMLFWKISAKWTLIIFIGKNISESTIVIDNFLCYFRTHIFVILEKTILMIYPIQNKKQHKTLSIRIIEFYFGEIENRITFYHCNIQNNINCNVHVTCLNLWIVDSLNKYSNLQNSRILKGIDMVIVNNAPKKIPPAAGYVSK